MPGDLGRVQRGPLIPSAPPDILEAVDDDSKVGRILQDGVSGNAFSDTGRSALPHHILFRCTCWHM